MELMDIYTIFHPKAPEGTWNILQHRLHAMCIYMLSLPVVSQSCLTLYDPMDCSPTGSSVHAILQARILEWLPFSSPIYMLSIYKFNKIEIILITFSPQKYDTRNQLQKQGWKTNKNPRSPKSSWYKNQTKTSITDEHRYQNPQY